MIRPTLTVMLALSAFALVACSGVSTTPTDTTAVDCQLSAEGLDDGSTTAFVCPAGCAGSGAPVWGTATYTTDSSVCVAAIHAGAITDAGGAIQVTRTGGLDSYEGSTQNGVTTQGYAGWPSSFTVAAP